jgi:hypothetical protein
MSALPEVNDVLKNIKMGRDRMDIDVALGAERPVPHSISASR